MQLAWSQKTNMTEMAARISFVTPTYRGDLEQFILLRESIERCEIDIPHTAIVNEEDMQLFQKIPFQHNLTILSTSDVLSKEFEDRRAAFYRKWCGLPHHDSPLIGWIAQQILKLSAASIVDTEAYLCLDSDTFFIEPVMAGDFYTTDGRLHLYETEHDLDAEMAEWYIDCLQFFKIPLQHQPLKRYIHAPVPLSRSVVLDMRAWMESAYSREWTEAFLWENRRAKYMSEYMLYGVFARHLHRLKTLAPISPPHSLYYWWPEQTVDITENFHHRLETESAKMVLINSNIKLPVSFYRCLVEQAWQIQY